MRCYDASVLREYLDQELESDRMIEVETHLRDCPVCRQKFKNLMDNDNFVNSLLAEHMGQNEMNAAGQKDAWTKLNSRIKGENKRRLGELNKKYRRIAAAAAVVIFLAGSLSFSSVRGAVAEFLSVFRVEKVQTISISPQDMSQIEQAIRRGVGHIDVKDFGTINVSGQEEFIDNLSPAEAQKMLGYTVLTPSVEGYDEPAAGVEKFGHKSFNLNVEKVNQLITSLGGTKLLPEELDGREFTIEGFAGINLHYDSSQGLPAFSLSAMKSPELVVPGGVDVAEVRDALLSLPFWPQDIKQQLAGIDDWQHTVVVPNYGQAKEIMVRGSKGIMSSDKRGNTCLLWVENGIIYTLDGQMSQDKALEIAESTK